MAKRERRNYLGDSTFDAVMFTARSLDRVVIMAWELFEDSDPSASDVIAELRRTVGLGARIGLRCAAPELHRNRAACSTLPGIVSTSHGANGTAISNFDWWLDAVGAVRANNFEPNAHIQAPRTSTSLSKLRRQAPSRIWRLRPACCRCCRPGKSRSPSRSERGPTAPKFIRRNGISLRSGSAPTSQIRFLQELRR